MMSPNTRSAPPRAVVVPALVTLLVGWTVSVGAAPASAHHGDDRVIAEGACSQGARWKLKVKTDDGRLEVEGEIDSNRTGQRWKWTIRHNGSVSARGAASTSGRSGSFEVERMLVDLAGTDAVLFRASHAGQVCRGVVNF